MSELASALDVSKPTSRWTVLAGTRFFLAWVVLTGHIQSSGYGSILTGVGSYLNQSSAVYGFLIISGYSIAASLERSRKGFYTRRLWRIYPTYIASIVLAVIAGHFIGGNLKTPSGIIYQPVSAYDAAIALVMLQSFIGPTLSTDGQLWTIAVEWWNYMLAPLFKRLPGIILTVFIALSLYAFTNWKVPDFPDKTSNGFMFMLLSWFWIAGFQHYRLRHTPWGYAVLFLPLLIAMLYVSIGKAAIVGIAAVTLCDVIRIPRQLRGLVEWLGELSYPMYAVHIPVIILCFRLHVEHTATVLVAAMFTSVAVLHLVDLPLRKWGLRMSARIRDGAVGKLSS